jgi:uncharacterized membrane protein YeaQ/YmgE (transglycosylase-associated protein family)
MSSLPPDSMDIKGSADKFIAESRRRPTRDLTYSPFLPQLRNSDTGSAHHDKNIFRRSRTILRVVCFRSRAHSGGVGKTMIGFGSDYRQSGTGKTKTMWSILWIVLVGFVGGIIARMLSPGPNNPSGFILTTVLGIAGAFVATFLGQTLGWYRPDQGASFIGATVGALIVLFIWNRLVAHRVIGDPGSPGATGPQR